MEFITAQLTDVAPLVIEFHYSHRAPKMMMMAGAIVSRSMVLAACIFNAPPARWNAPVADLCRLVRHPDAPDVSLSGLIGKTCRERRRSHHPNLLVSYADNTHAHHGGVYQASSWNYARFKPPSRNGWIIDGVFVPARSCFSRYQTCGAKLVGIMAEQGRTCVEHRDAGKHLYWRAMDKAALADAGTSGLGAMPYPKPDRSL